MEITQYRVKSQDGEQSEDIVDAEAKYIEADVEEVWQREQSEGSILDRNMYRIDSHWLAEGKRLISSQAVKSNSGWPMEFSSKQKKFNGRMF